MERTRGGGDQRGQRDHWDRGEQGWRGPGVERTRGGEDQGYRGTGVEMTRGREDQGWRGTGAEE